LWGFIVMVIIVVAWMVIFGFLQTEMGEFGFWFAVVRPPSWQI